MIDLFYTTMFGILAPCIYQGLKVNNWMECNRFSFLLFDIAGIFSWICFIASLIYLFFVQSWYVPVLVFFVAPPVGKALANIVWIDKISAYLFWLLVISEAIIHICNISIIQL